MPCSQSAVEPSLRPACTAVVRLLPPPSPHVVLHAPYALLDSRQQAFAFNQPLSFDTASVTTMDRMFWVRSSPCPAPNLQSSPSLHAACTAVTRRPPAIRATPPTAAYALRATRQGANSLSNANKLLIRCAWAGTSAFNSGARKGSGSWPSGSC